MNEQNTNEPTVKTIIEWYDELPAEIAVLAKRNTEWGSAEQTSLSKAVGGGFDWSESPEGLNFWSGVHSAAMRFEAGETPDWPAVPAAKPTEPSEVDALKARFAEFHCKVRHLVTSIDNSVSTLAAINEDAPQALEDVRNALARFEGGASS